MFQLYLKGIYQTAELSILRYSAFLAPYVPLYEDLGTRLHVPILSKVSFRFRCLLTKGGQARIVRFLPTLELHNGQLKLRYSRYWALSVRYKIIVLGVGDYLSSIVES